jgi:hypothetical protein
VFQEKGCTGCHVLTGVRDAAGTLGPPLTGVGATASVRRSTARAEEYLRESVKSPDAYIVPGYTSPSPMPPGLAAGKDLNDLVAFLLAQN